MTGRVGLESLDFILRAEATHLTDKTWCLLSELPGETPVSFRGNRVGRDTTQTDVRGTWKAGREHGKYVTFNSLMSSSPRSSRSSLVMQ